MTTGMVRFINDSGHSILQVCSKNQWKSYVPQCHPLKGCDNKQIAGLVGHWRMDEQSGNEVADDSGHENHGFANGPVPMLSKFSRGRYFVSAGVITVPNTASLNFGNSGFSVVGWVKILDVRYPLTTFAAKKGFGCYFGPAQPGGLPGWEIGQGYRDNGIRLCVRDNGNRVASKVIVFDDGYQPAQLLKQWVHYAVVFDREQQRKVYVYINGKKQSNTLDIPTVQGSVDNTRPLEFGYSYGWKTKGIMDEYRVYNIALDDYEAVSIYESHLV